MGKGSCPILHLQLLSYFPAECTFELVYADDLVIMNAAWKNWTQHEQANPWQMAFAIARFIGVRLENCHMH